MARREGNPNRRVDVVLTMRLGRRLGFLALVLLAVALAACAGAAASAPPSPAAPSSTTAGSGGEGPLVVLEVRGGECPQGACGGTTVIEREGRVHTTAPEAAELGVVPSEVLQGLIVEIDQADFDALSARPFSGECPVNVDGQELIYTFGTANGQVRLASCEVEIDPENPLFVAVNAAISTAAP